MEEELREQPKIRPLMVFPVKAPNGESICLRDPEGFSDATLVINHATYYMITLMDGSQSVRDIQAAFMRQTGALIPSEQIVSLIGQLRDAHFLDDEVFRLHRKEIEEGFLNGPIRPAVHSGSAYPDAPEALRSFLDGFFEPVKDSVGNHAPLSGIIVPHIDIRQAGPCYAAAYACLRESQASTLIILGTAHSNIGPSRYAICPKDFDTPLGLLPCDQEGIAFLQEATGVDWTQGQIGHRTEHSVEFQAVFLRYLFPEREIRIIPVLCNTFSDLMDAPEGPRQDPGIREFVDALRTLLRRRPGEAAMIAGADLSHMGPKFGHPAPVRETDLISLKTHDLSLMKFAEAGNPEGFWTEIRKDRDHHNVCGVPNIYTFLKVLEGEKGRLCDYGQFFESPTASAVSYASLVF